MNQLPAFWQVRQDQLNCEDVALQTIAEQTGTPVFVYSAGHIRANFTRFTEAMASLKHQICFSVKANSNLSVLSLLKGLGAGFDIVSGGELKRALAAGACGDDIVFSGVGKSEAEIRAALEASIQCFNVESVAELDRIEACAADMGLVAPIAIRVNPDVDPKTHPYISTGLKTNKFGIPHQEVKPLYRRIASSPSLDARGLDCHIGSQLIDLSPLSDALALVLQLWDDLSAEGIVLPQIDLGGGVGIIYRDETEPDLNAYGSRIRELVGGRSVKILFEPGRFLVGNAGALVTRAEYVKKSEDRCFVIVDGAMTDLIRPSLYGAYQRILPVQNPERCSEEEGTANIVGPVCESGDFLGNDRDLAFVEAGELLAVLSSGAYGFVMASNYNTRPQPAEVLVEGDGFRVIRPRQDVDSLFANELNLLEA